MRYSSLLLLFLIVVTLRAQVPTNGLVAFYPFSRNANDSSGNGNNGTLNGCTATTDRFGRSNSAYQFNGTSDYIIVNNSSSFPSTAITTAFWLNRTGIIPTGTEHYVSKELSYGTYLYTDSILYAQVWKGVAGVWSFWSTGAYRLKCDTNWVFYASTYDNATKIVSIYINGVLVNTINETDPQAIVRTSTNQMYIGRNGSSSVYFIKGKLDDLRIYNRVLTDIEIRALYHEGGWAVAPPTVSAISPTSGPIGSTVTITGTNFNPVAPNNFVYFGGVRATVSGANATLLTVNVPVGATLGPITVTDTTTGLTAYSNSLFSVSFGKGANIDTSFYQTKLNFVAPQSPGEPLAADLDGDGRVDLALGNDLLTQKPIAVLRNTSTEETISFAPQMNLAAGSQPRSLAVGDLNGDGKLDLIAPNTGGTTTSVFINTSAPGQISFSPKMDLAGGSAPDGPAIGDLDGDGKPDVLFTNLNDGSITIYRNTTSGNVVSFAPRMDVSVGSRPYRIVVSDLDGDGKPDVTIVDAFTNSVHLFRNTSSAGTISFAPKIDLATGKQPYRVAVVDFDGDGRNDIVSLNATGNSISAFRNVSSPGSIAFAARLDIPVGTSAQRIAQVFVVADLNGDSKPDVVLTRLDTSAVSIMQNTSQPGSISFGSRIDLKRTKSTNNTLTVADLDGNGQPEIIATDWPDSSFVVLKGLTPKPTVESPRIISIKDIPNDNGKQVFISWKVAHPAALSGISKFSIRYWDKANFNWVIVRGDVDAYPDTIHTTIAPTLYDSTKSQGMYYSVFQVAAHGVSPEIVAISPPDSGYSLDNIFPSVPTGLSGSTNGHDLIVVTWHPVPDNDLRYYKVYRDVVSGFAIDNATLIKKTADTTFSDNSVVVGSTYYYRVIAVDYSGNESAPSAEYSMKVMSVNNHANMPAEYALDQNYPNPFNPSTTIRFALPTRSFVTVEVMNTLGQTVASLMSAEEEACYHEMVWNATVSSGTYFIRIRAAAVDNSSNSFFKVRKMTLIK